MMPVSLILYKIDYTVVLTMIMIILALSVRMSMIIARIRDSMVNVYCLHVLILAMKKNCPGNIIPK